MEVDSDDDDEAEGRLRESSVGTPSDMPSLVSDSDSVPEAPRQQGHTTWIYNGGADAVVDGTTARQRANANEPMDDTSGGQYNHALHRPLPQRRRVFFIDVARAPQDHTWRTLLDSIHFHYANLASINNAGNATSYGPPQEVD